MKWSVLVPVKSPARAKSRLAATGSGAASPELVAALRADTLAAVRATDCVARVVIVTEEPGQSVGEVDAVIIQRRAGLNAALSEAWSECARRWPEDGVAALVADLPALRPEELAAALSEAGDTPLGYVADSPATGTTLLTARPGAVLQPRFGLGSAARHAQVATALRGGAGLRQDVDTPDDLRSALRLGAGQHTRRAATALGIVAPDANTDADPDADPDEALEHAAGLTSRSPDCARMAP